MARVACICFLLMAILLIQQRPVLVWSNQFTLSSYRDKALYGYSFLNISETIMEKCLERCLSNCLCMSFQLCDNELQLCSSNKDLAPSALHERKGCMHFHFDNKEVSKVNNQQCGESCMTLINCCVTSNPCLNGGTCRLSTTHDYTTRFHCSCPNGYYGDRCEQFIMQCEPGYTGQHCEHLIRSCRDYSNGSRIPGNYLVFDANMDEFEVYCDFDSSSTMAWTMIQSYKLANKEQFYFSPFFEDLPVSQSTPSWSAYRLSQSKIESINQGSNTWRITCRYNTDGAVYRDYLRVSNSELDILSFNNFYCINVEYIDVRGQNCTNCTACIWQMDDIGLHFDANFVTMDNETCDFIPSGLKDCGDEKETSFGFYTCVNPMHRCSSSSEATTQTWFGG